MRFGNGFLCVAFLGVAGAAAAQSQAQETGGWRKVDESKPPETKLITPRPAEPKMDGLVVAAGTRIPLALINSVSTKHSTAGDRVYLQTVYPVMAQNRIVIPAGSYVEGTVTDVRRPRRYKGKCELYVRFDSLTLPNGVTRDFRARLSGLDATVDAKLDRSEGKVQGETNKGKDAGTVAETAGAGAGVGTIAGAASGHPLTGLGMGAAGGAAAGIIGLLLSHGPDAVLERGTTVEMVLDRPLNYQEAELDFSRAAPPPPIMPASPAAQTQRHWWGWPL